MTQTRPAGAIVLALIAAVGCGQATSSDRGSHGYAAQGTSSDATIPLSLAIKDSKVVVEITGRGESPVVDRLTRQAVTVHCVAASRVAIGRGRLTRHGRSVFALDGDLDRSVELCGVEGDVTGDEAYFTFGRPAK